MNSVVIHFLRYHLSRDIPLIGWTSGARYVIAQRGCLLDPVKGIQMYNIEAGVFTDLERCTPSSVAGISADIPPNDIFGVGRPPCADDLLVDVVSFFDHSHWRAASMSKPCVATRAMFDGLLKGIFVYNVEEAALNHSRWDSSRLLHCPSGHSGTCKKYGSSLPRSYSSDKCLYLDSSRSIRPERLEQYILPCVTSYLQDRDFIRVVTDFGCLSFTLCFLLILCVVVGADHWRGCASRSFMSRRDTDTVRDLQ